MLLKNKLRSIYSRAVYGNVIAIIDHADGKSVTNDAENVIADLVRARLRSFAIPRDLQGYARHLGSNTGRPRRALCRFQQHK